MPDALTEMARQPASLYLRAMVSAAQEDDSAGQQALCRDVVETQSPQTVAVLLAALSTCLAQTLDSPA